MKKATKVSGQGREPIDVLRAEMGWLHEALVDLMCEAHDQRVEKGDAINLVLLEVARVLAVDVPEHFDQGVAAHFLRCMKCYRKPGQAIANEMRPQ